jgi:hypothetical protein
MCPVVTVIFGMYNSETVVVICSYVCKCPISPTTSSIVTQLRDRICKNQLLLNRRQCVYITKINQLKISGNESLSYSENNAKHINTLRVQNVTEF